ncbi:MAG TPA: DUF5672 family protein [Opitutaceae bacterium]|jgi:hypothetical protein
MLSLPTVTLLCIDCLNPQAALVAVRRSLAQCRFARAVLLTHEKPDGMGDDIEVKLISRLTSREAYSRFMLNELGSHFSTEHVLVCQWDGYVVNASAWRDEFLQHDYIGAKWWHRDGFNVGNGGFSLRSRKLVQAVAALGLTQCELNEDDVICRAGRPTLEKQFGIRFAEEAVADQFAFERGYVPGEVLPFGFHGMFNFWRVLSSSELEPLLDLLDARTILANETLELAQHYLKLKRHGETIAVAARVLDHNSGSVPALKMLCLAAHHSGRKWLAAVAMRELQAVEAAARASAPRVPEPVCA